jgi:hypothetical protein
MGRQYLFHAQIKVDSNKLNRVLIHRNGLEVWIIRASSWKVSMSGIVAVVRMKDRPTLPVYGTQNIRPMTASVNAVSSCANNVEKENAEGGTFGAL